ncbi:hypothetical protein [Streptomyces sp. NPDC004286]|uniref:hypothetical protein n=1 Tax=Streptomyces sp. NPDC004286 TaxID=3364696 RepID=UPI0036823310
MSSTDPSRGSDPLAMLAAETDPARRYKSAPTVLAAVQDAAARDLVAAHAGNASAAARELGISAQAVNKRLSGSAALPHRSTAVQREPAQHFATPDDAEAALLDYALRRQQLDYQRESFLLGALAAGVDPVRVAELSTEPLDLLRRIRPAGNISISALDPYDGQLDEFARAVTEYAAALTAAAEAAPDDPVTHTVAQVWRMEARALVRNAAPTALAPDPTVRPADYDDAEEFAAAFAASLADAEDTETDDPGQASELAVVSGPDAWLAAHCAELTSLAAQYRAAPDQDEIGQALVRVYEDIAAAIRHLRTTGHAPVLPEVAAR